MIVCPFRANRSRPPGPDPGPARSRTATRAGPPTGSGRLGPVLIVRGTRRFLDRVDGPTAAADDASTTMLGDWYATLLRRRSPVALFVNENTLLPVLVRLAPARTLLHRFPAALAETLTAHALGSAFVEAETSRMSPTALAPTANRSVVGIMNEFTFLADHAGTDDLVDLGVSLARTPCSPLFTRHTSPDRELHALVDQATR